MTCQICNAEPCECVPVEKWPEELVELLSQGHHVNCLAASCAFKSNAQRLANRIAGLEGVVEKLRVAGNAVAANASATCVVHKIKAGSTVDAINAWFEAAIAAKGKK